LKKGSEQCDDANTALNDGCDSGCLVENFWTCNTVPDPSTCTPICGDGIL